FSGFQAAGTRGRKLLEGAREVKIYGHWMPVNAEVTELPMLSAHADSDELMRWLSGFQRPPRRVFIVHGEPEASEALRERSIRELGWDATVPLQDQVLELYEALGGTSRLAPFIELVLVPAGTRRFCCRLTSPKKGGSREGRARARPAAVRLVANTGKSQAQKKSPEALFCSSVQQGCLKRVWSGKRDSNSRPQPWQGCALPTELFPQI